MVADIPAPDGADRALGLDPRRGAALGVSGPLAAEQGPGQDGVFLRGAAAMGRDVSGADAHEEPADVLAAAEWQLVLRAGREDPCVLGAAARLEAEAGVEVAAAAAAVLRQGNAGHRWGLAEAGD